jgi:hypothetical protein
LYGSYVESPFTTQKHLQIFEKRKLCRGNKRDPATGTQIKGDAIIGDLLQRNMTLLPFAIDPFGRLGPLALAFLFGTLTTKALTILPSRPHASKMHRRITSFPSPIGIFPHADHRCGAGQGGTVGNIPNPRAGPSFRFMVPTATYDNLVMSREESHNTTPNRQNQQKHRNHGGRAALLSSDMELIDQRDQTCGRPVHGVGRGRG